MAFKLPKRFDATIAESGVWVDVNDDNIGVNFGSFRCALMDKHTQRWKLTLARMEKEQSLRQKRNKILRSKGQKVEQEIDNFAAQLFVELSLLDWKGVLDENDAEVPYSKAAALEYFNHPETSFVLEQLYEQASNNVNYQPDSTDELETVEQVDAELAELEVEAEAETVDVNVVVELPKAKASGK